MPAHTVESVEGLRNPVCTTSQKPWNDWNDVASHSLLASGMFRALRVAGRSFRTTRLPSTRTSKACMPSRGGWAGDLSNICCGHPSSILYQSGSKNWHDVASHSLLASGMFRALRVAGRSFRTTRLPSTRTSKACMPSQTLLLTSHS